LHSKLFARLELDGNILDYFGIYAQPLFADKGFAAEFYQDPLIGWLRHAYGDVIDPDCGPCFAEAIIAGSQQVAVEHKSALRSFKANRGLISVLQN
jgi:hypothetical protein